MFIERRKKKNYRTFIYAALIVFLCLVIVVIAWPKDSSVLAADSEQTDLSKQQEDRQTLNAGDFIERIEDNIEDDDEDEQNITEVTDIAEPAETYYLVRRDGGLIKVYFVDEDGNEIELETTEIVYDVLGPEDQKLFDEGFRVDTQEQLAVLLQDFES